MTAETTVEAPDALPISQAPPTIVAGLAPETPAPRPGWRYVAEGGRDRRLDLLRGFAVFAMAVDHIAGQSWLYALTGGNRFFVSAAEAFVLLSGVVAGIAYGARARRDGLRATAPRLVQRAWLLYVMAVWLALTGALVAYWFDLPWLPPLARQDPTRFVLEILTLQRTFYLVDVMLLYAFLLLAAPLALALLRRRLWWFLLLLSWGVWAAYQLAPAGLQAPWPIADNPVFNLAPWQVLFFTGMTLGYGRDWLARRTRSRWLRSPLRDGWVLLLALPVGGLIWLQWTVGVPLDPYAPGGSGAALLDAWFDKSALPPARLVACAFIFAFAWALVTRYWRPIRAALGWFLLPLGERALYAYAAHLFLAALVHVVTIQVLRFAGLGLTLGQIHPGINSLIQLGALLVLWILTKTRFLASVTAPLAAPPFNRFVLPRPKRPRLWTFWRPSESLAIVMLVALVAALAGSAGLAPAAGNGQAPGGTLPTPKSYSTVTAPRKVGGPARGSADPPLTPAPVVNGTPNARIQRVVTPTSAPRESVTTPGYLLDAEFYSAALDRQMPYGIYLPPGYDVSASARRYPVLYMLHGADAAYSQWVSLGLAERAEALIEAGKMQPLIIVMPQGDDSYWLNASDGARWGDYLAFDLVKQIDATYRTLPGPASRAIGGLSRGGYGALQLAFTYPSIFGAVGGHSPSLLTQLEAPPAFDDADYFLRYDPLRLAATIEPSLAPRVWLDAGENDSYAPRVTALYTLLHERGITTEYHAWTGAHDDSYWIEHAADYLRFYNTVLRGE